MERDVIQIQLTEQGKPPYLSTIFPEGLPYGVILNKTICGLGATYSCIKKVCHTIIIELNLPVIQSKAKDPTHADDNIFPVYGDTKTEDIASYLERTLQCGKFIKVLSTPESYYKLQDALEEIMGSSFYKEIFIVLDEIHKYVVDDHFRDFSLGRITEEFWKYEKRSVVSATPLLADDPRYTEKGMREIVLQPEWDYKKPLRLTITNDVSQSLKNLLTQLDSRLVFIACNSVKLIRTYIEESDTASDSVIFCAKETAKEIEDEGIKTYSDWDVQHIGKYNWMTSRFWTGFDLTELPDSPVLIMLTDCNLVEHTMIDPAIDAVQFVGRFRQGVSEIHHITNVNTNHKYRTTDHIKGYQEAQKEAYNKINALISLQDNNDIKSALHEILKSCPWSKNLNGSLEINHLAVANNAHTLAMQAIYSGKEHIEEAYQRSSFKVDVFTEQYDERVIKIKNMPGHWKQRKTMMEMLDEAQKYDQGNGDFETLLREFRECDSWFVDAYLTIGSNAIRECHYKTSVINHLIAKKRNTELKLGEETIKYVKSSFVIGSIYTRKEIKQRLSAIYKEFSIGGAPKATDIKYYFEVKQRKMQEDAAFLIIAPLF